MLIKSKLRNFLTRQQHVISYLLLQHHATYGILILALTTTPFNKHTQHPFEGTSMIPADFCLSLSLSLSNNNDNDNDNDNRVPKIEVIQRYYCIFKSSAISIGLS